MIIQFITYSSECVDESKTLFNSKHYNQSIDRIYDCIEGVIDSKLTGELTELYYGLGINYSKLGSIDSSLKYFKLARFASKSIDDDKLKAQINNEIAINYTNLGLNHKSIKFLKNSLALNLRMNRKKGIIINYINLGHSFLNISMLDSAYYYYNMAYNLNPKRSDLKSTILNNMGSVEFSMGNYDNASHLFDDAIEFSPKSKVDEFTFKSNYDISQIALNRNPIYYRSEFSTGNASVLNYLSEEEIYFKSSIYSIHYGDFDKAQDDILKAIGLYVQKSNYTKAKEILTEYISIMKLKISPSNISPEISEQLNVVMAKEQMQYSKLLLGETQRNITFNNTINNLNKKLETANMNIYLLISFIITLILLVPISIRYVVVNKVLSQVKRRNDMMIGDLKQLNDSRIKRNLAIIVNYIFLDRRYSNDDKFIEVLDNLVEGSNELSKVIRLNYKGELNGEHSSTNELPMDR